MGKFLKLRNNAIPLSRGSYLFQRPKLANSGVILKPLVCFFSSLRDGEGDDGGFLKESCQYLLRQYLLYFLGLTPSFDSQSMD